MQNADFPVEGTEGIRSSPDARILILSSRPPQLSHRRPATATVPHRCRQIQTTVDPVGGLGLRSTLHRSCAPDCGRSEPQQATFCWSLPDHLPLRPGAPDAQNALSGDLVQKSSLSGKMVISPFVGEREHGP